MQPAECSDSCRRAADLPPCWASRLRSRAFATVQLRPAQPVRRRWRRTSHWASLNVMSLTQRLTDDAETPTRRAISFIERPWRRSLLASLRSSVFISDNTILRLSDEAGDGDR